MSKSDKLYKIFMTTMIVAIAVMLLASGIIAVQKSMKLKVGVSITPSMLCKITDSDDNVLFCNTTKNNQTLYVTEGASISGNMLTLNKSFSNLGGEFALKIYNYTTVETSGNVIKVTASGTGVESTSMWLPSYSSGTPIAGEINVTAVAGSITLQFEEVAKPSFTVTYNLTDCTSNQTSGASVTYGTSYSATITPTTRYLFTQFNVINISDGGYTWNNSTGVFTITDWTKVNGNITITAAAEQTYWDEGTYIVYEYGKGSNVDDNRAYFKTGLHYKYYIEMGEYPQTGADSTTEDYLDSNYASLSTDANGYYTYNGAKYARVESPNTSYSADSSVNFYKVEPVRWIVLGGVNDVTSTDSETNEVVFDPSEGNTLTYENKTFIYNGTQYS